MDFGTNFESSKNVLMFEYCTTNRLYTSKNELFGDENEEGMDIITGNSSSCTSYG